MVNLLRSKAVRFFLLLLFGCLGSHPAFAQPSPTQIYDAELRQFFSTVAPITNGPRFLYDMSSHMVDSVFFRYVVPDTNWVDNWTRLYDEMYHAAYDTTTITPIDALLQQLDIKHTNDTIRVALLDYDYALLKPDALTTGTYFDFDTANDAIYDKPGAPAPYTLQQLFSGTTLEQEAPFGNPTFRIDPALMFRDPGKQYNISEWKLMIDFDDSTGWHAFSSWAPQYYQPQYDSAGEKVIQYALVASGQTLAYNLSKITILNADPAPVATTKITDIPGIDVDVYDPPADCNPNAERKYLIYMEGLDLLNEVGAQEIYKYAVTSKQLQQLRNFGYTFVIVNWQDAHQSVRTHADQLIKLIEYLKTLNQPIRKVPQPFVIAGESMGGVVARYALCKMETGNYSGWGVMGVPHNTRLMITIDAPHQGANIPMSLQYLYKYYMKFVGLAYSPVANFFFSKYLHLLDAPAARELLIDHVDTDPSFLLPVSVGGYGPHPARQSLLKDLAQMGDYPKYCKTMAISDGSWNGGHQTHHWDGSPRSINDHILLMETKTTLRVLGIKILGAKTTFDMRTNPNNYGLIFRAGSGISHWKLKLYWFGVKLKWWTDYLVSMEKTATNLQPYCVMPGSWTVTPGPVLKGAGNSFNSFNFFSIFGYQVNNQNGNISISAYAGVPYVAQTSFNFTGYSDGASFCYIPTRSSFDYQGAVPLDYPIIQDAVATTMSQTPFDVVYTNPTDANWLHMRFSNPLLIPGGSNPEVYQTCEELQSQGVPNVTVLPRRLLNREIGDDELYLENSTVNYQKPIEVERVLHVNQRNPYYNYSTALSSFSLYSSNPVDPFYRAVVLSKDNSCDFAYTGGNSTLADDVGLDVNPNQTPTGNYQWVQTSITNCCRDIPFRLAHTSGPAAGGGVGTLLTVFPNPAGPSGAVVRYQLLAPNPATLRITDAAGRIVCQRRLEAPDASMLCQQAMPVDRLQPGLYFVEVRNSTSRLTTKISVQP